jgi:dihydrodipicolinate synthase/N-acetylneuraminate lyase
MAHGGLGIISVFQMLIKEMKNISSYPNDLLLHSNIISLLKMMNLLFVETSPSPIKYVMSKLDYVKTIVRLPLKNNKRLKNCLMKR